MKPFKHNNKPAENAKTNPTPKAAIQPQQAETGNFWHNIVDGLHQVSRLNLAFYFIIPLITTLTLEWIARGTLGEVPQGNGFFQALWWHAPSFVLSYFLLLFIYAALHKITTLHSVSILLVGLLGNLPAAATFYKLTLRNEPFLPWDLGQIEDFVSISGEMEFVLQHSMIATIVIFTALVLVGGIADYWQHKHDKVVRGLARITAAAACTGGVFVLLLGLFLNPFACSSLGIYRDMWMQDRYYRNNGVITGFLTNLQMLRIEKPAGYNDKNVLQLVEEARQAALTVQPYYPESYASFTQQPEEQPDIIYVMAESFWDVTRLPGITYDQDIIPNLTALRQEAAFGYVHSPSFGGGTCDVEFEALTGFSMENLPAGAKPYQQYMGSRMPSLPNYLLDAGYDTLALHGYGARFWNRDKAYPQLGIDEFFASDTFVGAERRRGFVSDNAMVERIIQEHWERSSTSASPLFIHTVTMQNHTTYSRDRYPADYLVRVTSAPDSIPDSTIGQLEDCATGIRDMDAALGKLIRYLRSSERKTIVVFWGDHMNPMSDGYTLFENTGYIEAGDTTNPKMYQTPLLIWSNYASTSIDLGTISAFNISPVMMDIYGLEKPLYFDYLMQQFSVMHGRTRGHTIGTDSAFSEELTALQQEYFNKHAILQYELMFGKQNPQLEAAS